MNIYVHNNRLNTHYNNYYCVSKLGGNLKLSNLTIERSRNGYYNAYMHPKRYFS